jgi:hypothetical protein
MGLLNSLMPVFCSAQPHRPVTENWAQNSGNTQNEGQSPSGATSGSGTSGGWSYSRTASHSYEKEPAVTTYDLYNMQKGEMRIIAANMGDTLHVHALPYFQMNRLIAETRMPLNPYDPNARIPRIQRRMPDYEGFLRQMLATFAPVQESHREVGYSPWREPSPPASSPAGKDSAPQSPWLTPDPAGNDDTGWGIPDEPVGKGRPAFSPPPAPDNRPVVHYTFINSGSGTMNVNIGNGTLGNNGAVTDNGAWGTSPALPAPPTMRALPAPDKSPSDDSEGDGWEWADDDKF